MDSQLFQYFVSIKLSKDDREYKWDPAVVEESIRAFNPYTKSDRVRHTLHITQGILDDAAQSGELNLVQVSSIDLSGKSIVAPLVYLTSGAHYQTRLDVVLPDAMVVFNLAKGSGPIHLLGLHTVAVPSEDLDLSEAEEEEAGDADTDNEIEMKETEAEGEAIHLKHSPEHTHANGVVPAPPAAAVNNEKKRKIDADDEEGTEEGEGAKDKPSTNGNGTDAATDTEGDAAAPGGMKKPKLVGGDEVSPDAVTVSA